MHFDWNQCSFLVVLRVDGFLPSARSARRRCSTRSTRSTRAPTCCPDSRLAPTSWTPAPGEAPSTRWPRTGKENTPRNHLQQQVPDSARNKFDKCQRKSLNPLGRSPLWGCQERRCPFDCFSVSHHESQHTSQPVGVSPELPL